MKSAANKALVRAAQLGRWVTISTMEIQSMRYVKIVVGLLLIAKGVVDFTRLPGALAATHAHSALAVGHVSTGFLAGEAAGVETGLVVGALAVLIGGVLLVASAWRRGQSSLVNTVAS